MSVTFATAQNNNPVVKTESKTVTVKQNISKQVSNASLVIKTKGIKKIEEIILEDLSKQTFLDLMLLRKTKKIIC